MVIKSLAELMTPDPRFHYFNPDGTLSGGAEYDLSVTPEKGRKGPEGWPDGYLWHLECQDGTLLHVHDLGGNPFLNVNDWLIDLTGYTREEFVELACK